jgi:hypothetical protein
MLYDGSTLPDFISLDASTGVFTVTTALATDIESYSIVVTASVGAASASGSAFNLVVSAVGYGGDITVTSVQQNSKMFQHKSYTFILASSVAIDTTDIFVITFDSTIMLKGACSVKGDLISTSPLCTADTTSNTVIIQEFALSTIAAATSVTFVLSELVTSTSTGTVSIS